MLHTDTIKKLAEVLKLDVSEFTTKLKSDNEETLEVPTLYTEDQYNAFGTNKEEIGVKKASEILIKDLKKKHGIEYEGKDPEKFLSLYSDKVLADAKVDPDKQVLTLRNEKKALQESVANLTTEKENITKNFTEKLFHVETRNQIGSLIPDNTIIPKEDLIDLFMNRHRVTKEDNSVVIYKGEQALKDNALNPIPVKDVVAQFTEPYIKKNGMGGNDDKGGGTAGTFKTASELTAYMQKKGINAMSPEGLKLYSDNKKAVATFDENS
jgi:hypothetical protein